MEYIYFKTYDELISTPHTFAAGHKVYVEDEKKAYVFNGEEWVPLEVKSESNVQMSAYEMNKQIIGQMSPLKHKDMISKYALINEFVKQTENCYYLMYGREINYFTLFVKTPSSKETLSLELAACLRSVGDIYDILLTETQDAIEIWVKPVNAEEVTCLYFFPYDAGIVPFGG